jgi:phosphate-selective porin OprO/OprP
MPTSLGLCLRGDRIMRTRALLFLLVALLVGSGSSRAQDPQSAPAAPANANNAQNPPAPQPQAGLDDAPLAAGDEEVATPAHDLVKWNKYEGDLVTFRLGAGFLLERAGYSQDQNSKEQFALFPETKIRDARIILKGGFKFDRPLTWSAGIMYDVPTKKFLVRETGVMVAVPELSGYLFFGRTKEGFSLNKVMVGYAGWTMERTEISDATIPILADGVKWLGYAPQKHLIWNLGVFGDKFSEGQTFSTYAYQAVGRFAWLPIENERTILHIGTSLRYGKPDDDVLQLRSRPEAFEAPYFVDTGQFPAEGTKTSQFELYYRPGSLLMGTEYFFQNTNAPTVGNPSFNGGNVVVSWLPTGEIRAYNTRGGFFDQISPLSPVFQGGPGAWELVANFSYVDLDSAAISGGRFWRFTPMVNWHLSDNMRLEFAYGFGSLNRFGLVGHTQFFQSRIQLQL